MMDERELFQKGLAHIGLSLTEGQMEQFMGYTRLLLETNKTMNLTTITDPGEVMVKHHLDCLYTLNTGAIPEGARIIDVGCGAGFPGLPLKIARPDIQLTLLDATEKKIRFLERTAAEIGLEGINFCAGRAEELAAGTMRERFDVGVSRAVAALPMLLELGLPFVKKEGCFIALKGPALRDELAAAQGGLQKLGGTVEQVMEQTLYGTDITHLYCVLRKIGPTPKQYPRAFAKIKKQPL